MTSVERVSRPPAGERATCAGADRRPVTAHAAPAGQAPAVLALTDHRAACPELTGSKAAALSRAAAEGLAVVPGFVLTTSAVDRLTVTGPPTVAAALPEEVVDAWRELSDDGAAALVVRSSSTVEDLGGSSMAGRFVSVVGVQGLDAFVDAVREVIGSRTAAAEGASELTGQEPLAVLVQPLLDARCGGVLFGIDPVSGREDRLVVAAVEGGPDRLVSGAVDGSRYALALDGELVEQAHGDGSARLDRRQLHELAGLARRTAQVFGGPQDVEWAYDGQGRLRLLQSRPVTAEPRGVPSGPHLGPGPVAETFPLPLRRLEGELWVPPLRRALQAALSLAGTASRTDVDASPLAVVVGGRVAVDLDLLEGREGSLTLAERLDPRPRVRALRASWRVGRLKAALPALGRDVVERADEALGSVPDLGRLSDRQLVAMLHRCAPALTSVHTHEVLVGLLVRPASSRLTGVSTAMRVLAQGRASGYDDAQLLSAHPVLLALVPPRIGPPTPLPPGVRAPAASRDDGEDDEAAAVREALRLRARWLQELTARTALELGRRLAVTGRLPHAEDVAHLSLEQLSQAVRDPQLVLEPVPEPTGEPLPARFQLSDRGLPVRVHGTGDGTGTGAGGGRGTGPVHTGPVEPGAPPPEGCVLVVRTLDPGLAPVLPRLAGLVAETGSVLAHLAILARESGVPTVVGLAGALDDLPAGTVVEVDGDSGRVTPREGDDA